MLEIHHFVHFVLSQLAMFDFPPEGTGRLGLKPISKEDPPEMFFDVTDWSTLVLFKPSLWLESTAISPSYSPVPKMGTAPNLSPTRSSFLGPPFLVVVRLLLVEMPPAIAGWLWYMERI